METQVKDPIIKHRLSEKNVFRSSSRSSLHGGYFLLGVSFLIFGLVESQPEAEENNLFMMFFLHYFLALAYGGILIYHNSYGLRKSWQKENINKTMVLLNLFLIS